MSESGKAIFLSYASQDAGAARRICETLRAAGIEVWFDQNELRGGDAWDQDIRRQIRDCALFMPIISAATQARREGYFRREWNLATDRVLDMAQGTPFVVPVVIDDTKDRDALVPEAFLKVQWTRLPRGETPAVFAERVQVLLGGEARGGTRQPFGAAMAGGDVPARSATAWRVPVGVWLGACAAVVAVAVFFALRRNAPATAGTPAVSAGKVAPAAERFAASAAAIDEKSVAVLPFANLSGDRDQEYFSDGLTEEIINALTRERGLSVRPRATAFSFKGRNASAAEIATALRVARLVEGSVQRAGTRVRIRVTLTRVADNTTEELGTFTEELADVFALQDKVARAVVQRITGRIATGAVAALTKSSEAYDAYLRGRALQVRAAGNRVDVVKHYEQAVGLDPAFALAWARLAEARFRSYGAGNDRSAELVAASRLAIDRALAAQPDLPEALIARANWARYVQDDFAAARRDLDRAEALQPPTAELRLAQFMLAREVGDWAEAQRLAEACLSLDPQNGDHTNAIAVTLYAPRGDLLMADRLYARAVTIQGPSEPVPFNNRVALRGRWRGAAAALRLAEAAPSELAGRAFFRINPLLALGRPAEARVILLALEEGAVGARTDSVTNLRTGERPTFAQLTAVGEVALARQRAETDRSATMKELERGNRSAAVFVRLAQIEHVLGRDGAALALLEEARRDAQKRPGVYMRVFDFALRAQTLYAQLGQADREIELLREYLGAGFHLGYDLRDNPGYAPIRADPRFQEIVKQEAAWAAALPDPVEL